MIDVVMPQMGESIVEGTLTKWLKKPGERPQGGHRFSKPARNDISKIIQIRLHIQRETVRSDPAAHVYADRGDFAPRCPDAGGPGFTAGGNAEPAQSVDQNLLERADVGHDVALPFSQIDNGVTDDLPGTVVRHVASAVGPLKGDARALQHFWRRQQILVMGVAPHGDDMRMLDDQQLIRNFAALALFHEVALQRERFAVADAA